MAYDPQYNGTILFGGFDAVTAAALSDTWLFANNTWTDLTTTRGWTTGPIGVWWQFLAYDPAGPYLLMFGGRNNSLATAVTNATWELNTTGWHQLTPTTAPSARAFGAMFYDPVIQKMVLFGGACNYCSFENDTWFFANGTWTNVTSVLTTPAPPADNNGNWGWDTALNAGVVYGGTTSVYTTAKNNQTWLFRTGWNRSLTTGYIPGIGNSGGVYDSAARAFLVVAGEDNNGTDWNTTYALLGTRWTDLTSSVNLPASFPSARCCEAISYDPLQNEVVIFGGNNYTYVSARQSDTWTLSLGAVIAGITATPSLGRAPLNVSLTSTVYGGTPPDSYNWSFGDGSLNSTLPNVTHVFGRPGIYTVRLRVVDANGNSTNVTTQVVVQFSGGWVEPASAISPAPDQRGYMATAFDPQLAGVLLYGGHNLSSGGTFGDTWLFSNGTWTNLNSSGQLPISPPALWNADLTWDPDGPYMVLFGGRDVTAFYNETWIFNLTGWHQLKPALSPSVREETQFFYDPANGKLVLFGGTGYNFLAGNFYGMDDTWFFSSGSWTNVTAALKSGSPPATTAAATTWDPAIDRAVMFGGAPVGGACAVYSTTWTFGTGWNNTNLTYDPGPEEAGATSAFDPQLNAVVFFGADLQGTCGERGDTWEFANDTWTNITSALTSSSSVPPERYSSRLAWDPIQKVLVLFGGVDNGGANYSYGYGGMNDTWTFPYAPLTAQLQANATIGYPTFHVALKAVVNGGLGPYQVNWSFGSIGANQTTLQANQSYPTPGTYTVDFRATDTQGRSINRSIQLQVVGPMTASANASVVAGDAPLLVNFTAPITGGAGPYTYAWSFGDGGTSTLSAPSHRYTTAGNYTAQVLIKDVVGQQAVASVAVEIYATLGVSIGIGQPRAIAPEVARLPATVSGGRGPYLYTWEFGDGTAAPGNASPVHTYAAAGTYVINVTVQDSFGKVAHATDTIQVAPPVTAMIGTSASYGTNPFSVSFSASATGGFPGYSYVWQFGDGTANATGNDQAHTYSAPGSYQVNVTITDSAGFTGRASVIVEDLAPLAASITLSAAEVDAPANVTFYAAATGGRGPYSYVWSFGDGSGSNLSTPTHRYAVAGKFSVVLTTTDALGTAIQSSRSVLVNPALRATAYANVTHFQLGGAVTISASVSGGAGDLSYAWSSLPTGCTAGNVTSFSCTPAAAAVYNVTVTITDSLRVAASASVLLNVTSAGTTGGCLVSCSPPPSGGSGGLSTLDLLLIAAVGVAVAGVVGAVAWARVRRPPPPPEETAPPDMPPEDPLAAPQFEPAAPPE